MFWTEYGDKGHPPSVHRARISGKKSKRLMSTGLFWPNALASQGEELYVGDGAGKIFIMDFHGDLHSLLSLQYFVVCYIPTVILSYAWLFISLLSSFSHSVVFCGYLPISVLVKQIIHYHLTDLVAGARVRELSFLKSTVFHVYGLVVFDHLLFYSDWYTNGIHMVDMVTGKQEPVAQHLSRPTSLIIYHPGNLTSTTL